MLKYMLRRWESDGIVSGWGPLAGRCVHRHKSSATTKPEIS